MNIEWKDNELYRITVEGVRIYVGKVMGFTSFKNPWFDVYVKRTRKHTFTTEEHARRQLERYAEKAK